MVEHIVIHQVHKMMVEMEDQVEVQEEDADHIQEGLEIHLQ